MLGELFAFHLFKKFDSGIWIAQGYMEGLGELSDKQKWRNALQTGVHLLAFGPIAGWVAEDEEGQKEKRRVAEIAKELIVNAWEQRRSGSRRVRGICLRF